MIELDRLTKRYDDRVAVDNFSLTVQTGAVVALVGTSGCGKTTTLKMVNRLVEPTSGTVRIHGRDTSSIPPVTLRRSIGYVFQQIGLFPHMTVQQNVAIVPDLLGWKKQRIRQRVEELLEMVELDPSEFLELYPRELSGGQRQRVGVARALAADPEVMLMDEPFGALDPLTRDGLQREFLQLQQSLHKTVIFVTHDMNEALLVGEQVAVMDAGALVQIGTPQELTQSPANDWVARLLETPRRLADRMASLTEGNAPTRQDDGDTAKGIQQER